MKTTPCFGVQARLQQVRFRSTLSPAAGQAADDKGKRNRHLLAHGHELENLFPALRGGPASALQFFADRRIQWWTSSRSGDLPRTLTTAGPTRNLASSQVCCVNFLLPLVAVPDALLALMRAIDPDVEEVVAIVDDGGRSSPVEIEWVGWRSPLEGGAMTRGANVTSIDALLVVRARGCMRAYLVEWKYCEEYRDARSGDKSGGSKGDTRRKRYRALFASTTSSFQETASFEEQLHEPFYQLMRMHLLADRILEEGITRDLRVDEVRVVVVCPRDNNDYRIVPPLGPIGLRSAPGTTVEETVRARLRRPHAFAVLAQEDLVAALRLSAVAPQLVDWLDYHARRYDW